MTKKELHAHLLLDCGGLSKPSKMPGLATMHPPWKCKRGCILRGELGSVCHNCYGMKGRMVFDNVKEAMVRQEVAARRALSDFDLWPVYALTMARAIEMDGRPFRHFATGDLMSHDHLALVCSVARQSHNVRHWVSTREWPSVQLYLHQGGVIPANMTIRISADWVDESPERAVLDLGLPTSTVVTDPKDATCPVTLGHAKGCDEAGCNACWRRDVPNVAYLLH